MQSPQDLAAAGWLRAIADRIDNGDIEVVEIEGAADLRKIPHDPAVVAVGYEHTGRRALRIVTRDADRPTAAEPT